MFNWRRALRFAPTARAGAPAARDTALIGQHDLVLTTYGTMLRDAAQLAEMEFDYVVLDEAQAVKNSSTASAKAVRLLRGTHRLALSGTPVENHLGELWSLFEFSIGHAGRGPCAQHGGRTGAQSRRGCAPHSRQALRPFILRRTKQQVARELPRPNKPSANSRPAEKQYDNCVTARLCWRACNRKASASRMHVLEALLRLRQRPAIPDCSA
jgi:hypothetical protein